MKTKTMPYIDYQLCTKLAETASNKHTLVNYHQTKIGWLPVR